MTEKPNMSNMILVNRHLQKALVEERRKNNQLEQRVIALETELRTQRSWFTRIKSVIAPDRT